jgi:hypothetical protein
VRGLLSYFVSENQDLLFLGDIFLVFFIDDNSFGISQGAKGFVYIELQARYE